MKSTIRKTLVGTAIGATALVGVGASPAMAGEVSGNYKVNENGEVVKGKLWTPKGKSECAFSGQNDGFHDPVREAHGDADAGDAYSDPCGRHPFGYAGTGRWDGMQPDVRPAA